MKNRFCLFKFILFLLPINLTYTHSKDFFEGIDFYTSIKSQSKDTSQTLSSTVGARFRSANLVAITTFDSADLTKSNENDFFNFTKKNYGIKLSTVNINLPYRIDLYTGTLRYGKGLSRLKNPLLPSSSAFKSLAIPLPGIAPALPTFSSSKKPLAVAFKFTSQGQNYLLPTLQLALSSEGNKAASIIEDIQFGNVQTIFGVSVATFKHGKTSPDKTWKLKEPFYPERFYAASDVEFATNINGIIKSSVIIGASENPTGGIKDAYCWVQANETLTFKGLKLNASYFETKDKQAILPTGKKITTKNQLQLNQQLTFNLPVGTLKTAILMQTTTKLATSKTPEHEEYNLKTALYFSRKKNKITLQYNLSSVPLKEKITHSAKFSLNHSFETFSSTTSINASFADTKKTYSLSQKVTPKNGSFSSINMGYSTTFIDDKYDSSKINGGVTFKSTAKKTNWSASVSISNTF